MQIKEVQEKLKISSYTLRYYEKMGLIQPYRDENGYRNYNEEDIHKIERIMFLRDINVPIEDIKDILDNKVIRPHFFHMNATFGTVIASNT